ncbi:MAG: amidohydrolase [Thermoplasmata archaeon]|nr:amidohydrolase [Thermoplasmata archaeon]
MSLLIYNAVIGKEDYEWLLIEGDKISKLGKDNPPSAARKIDARGGYVVPGFCDSHAHLINIAIMHEYLDLTGKSRREVFNMAERECEKRKIIIGRGWDESFWEEKRYITREELDDVCSKPVLLIREDGHVGVANTAMLKKMDVWNDEGVLKENLLEKILKRLKIGDSLNFEYAQNYALSKGITCVHDFANIDTLKKYMEMHRRGELKIRIFASFYGSAYQIIKKLGLYSGYGNSYLRIGALKLFADGSIGAETAATRYIDGKVVKPLLRAKKLKNILKDANSRGIKVMTHAIGDTAIDEVLKAYREYPGNRIEHVELVREEQLNPLGKMELSMQPNFLKWNAKGGLYYTKLGEEWLERNNPYRKLIDSGAKLLFGSDCMPMDPLFGIYFAVNSRYPQQRIEVHEAFKAYTEGSKYMNSLLGEIKEGYLADLVVLSDDPERVREGVNKIKIKMTIVNGKLMYTSE